MKGEEKTEPKKFKRNENVIPDYDYLFSEQTGRKGKKKMGFFLKLIKLNVKPMILSCFILLLMYAPQWLNPVLTANIINSVTENISSGLHLPQKAVTFILVNFALMFVFIATNIPITIWRWRVVSKMTRRTSAGIKASVVRKLQGLSITYHKDMESGKIQSKFLKDTESVDVLFSNVMNGIIPSSFTILVALVIALSKSWIMSLFFLVMIPIDVLLVRCFKGKLKKSYHDYRVQTENLSAKMTSMLEMMPVTKSHGLENVERSSFNQTILGLSGAGRRLDDTTAKFGAGLWVIHATINALCLAVCVVLALKKIIGIGDVVLYQSMFAQISNSISSLVTLIPAFGSGLEALSSVSEIMNATDVEVNIGKTEIPSIKGDVTFDHVDYCYPHTSQFVVKDFSLDVKAGECIAVVGASGSGKSTLMNMIIGLLSPVQGEIRIDGKPLTELELSKYRHNLSVVPQNSILFTGTMRENITYGMPDYTEEQLQKAVEMANLKEFIDTLPEGLNTQIGEHGGKLSGGQKQRITIARALIRDPKILILDEATSALDNISELHVQKAIASSIKGRTTFIVAHRLSTIRDADRIVVMEEGKAVEIGTYEELMNQKGKFFALKELNEMTLKSIENE